MGDQFFQIDPWPFQEALAKVKATLAIRLTLRHFGIGHPMSSSFLAAIATCLNEQRFLTT
jgi:hypothetical protein